MGLEKGLKMCISKNYPGEAYPQALLFTCCESVRRKVSDLNLTVVAVTAAAGVPDL